MGWSAATGIGRRSAAEAAEKRTESSRGRPVRRLHPRLPPPLPPLAGLDSGVSVHPRRRRGHPSNEGELLLLSGHPPLPLPLCTAASVSVAARGPGTGPDIFGHRNIRSVAISAKDWISAVLEVTGYLRPDIL